MGGWDFNMKIFIGILFNIIGVILLYVCESGYYDVPIAYRLMSIIFYAVVACTLLHLVMGCLFALLNFIDDLFGVD